MSTSTEPTPSNHKSQSSLITQIITGVIGALVVGLQGVSLSETSSNQTLIRQVEAALHNQNEVIQSLDQEGRRIDAAMENQKKLMEHMETLLHNQQVTLDLLDKNNSKGP